MEPAVRLALFQPDIPQNTAACIAHLLVPRGGL